MTISTIPDAYDRISMTDAISPLAVFRSSSYRSVDAMFANTVLTQRRIEQGDINYLGTFHRDNIHEAREKLAAYAEAYAESAAA